MKEQLNSNHAELALNNLVRNIPWNSVLEISARVARRIPEKRRFQIAQMFLAVDSRGLDEEELLIRLDNYDIWMQNNTVLDKLIKYLSAQNDRLNNQSLSA